MSSVEILGVNHYFGKEFIYKIVIYPWKIIEIQQPKDEFNIGTYYVDLLNTIEEIMNNAQKEGMNIGVVNELEIILKENWNEIIVREIHKS